MHWQDGFIKDFTTGGISAAVSKTINAPFERAKLLMQLNRGKYRSVWDCLTKILKEDGHLGYWRGNFTNILRYFPTQALNFAFKDYYKNMFLPKPANEYSYWEFFGRNLMLGGFAGATTWIGVHPLDLARTRITVDKGKGCEKNYSGIGDCVKKTWCEGGFRALYKGFTISIAAIIPYRAIYFGGYDTLKRLFIKDEKKASFWLKCALSEGNTIVAQYLIYPIDTIRRKLMVAGEKQKDGRIAPSYRSSFHCAKTILKESGMKGFYKGGVANIYRATGAALCMVFYDTLKLGLG